jgi:ribosomal protein S18 acetylase RimI-like enzyme
MNDVAIRRATETDLPALGRLGGQLMRVHYAFDRQRFMSPGSDPESGYASFLGTQLAEPDAIVFVAERGARIAGYVYASLEPRSWKELREPAGFIHDLAVEPECRGLRIGTALLEAAVAWLRGKGAPRVLLWTAEPNEAARRLFEQHGFRRTMVEMTKEL